jgi:hypothetical protein
MAIPDDIVAFDHSEYPDLYIRWGTGIPVECTQFGLVVPEWRDLHHAKGDELGPEYPFDIVFHPHVIDTLIEYTILGKKEAVNREFNEERCNGIYLVIQYLKEEHTVSRL